MRFRPRLVALALFTSPFASASAQHDLFTLPIADPAYRQFDGLSRTGCVAARVSPYRPYLLSSIRRALVSAVRDDACRGELLDELVRRFRPDTTPPPPLPEPGAVPPGPVMLEDIAERPEEEEPTGLGVGIEGGVRLTSVSRGVIRPLWLDVRPTAEGAPSAVGYGRFRVTWDGGDRIAAVAEATAQTSGRNDPLVRARSFRTTSGFLDFTEAYVNARLGRVALSFGRAREAWLGEGEESTVLSAHGPPLDRFLVTARWSRLEIRAIFASIDDVVLTVEEDSLVPGTPPQRLHRMLAGHAFTIRPTRGWEVTLGETALLSRRGGGVDLAFANPLMLYLVTEHDTSYAGGSATGNNLTVFGSTRFQRGRLVAEAEIVVDDIQIDAADRAVIPHQLAWRLSGTMGFSAPWPASIGVEYRRADSYAYMRRYYSEVYHQFGRPLGTELGPDANMVRASGDVWPTSRVRFAVGVGRWNRGALRLTQRPAQAAFGHAGEPYPSVSEERPAVQEAWLGDASVEWLDTQLPVRLTVELAQIDNVNNQPGESGNFLRAHLVASYRFRYP
jgi:hypothetical protein